MKILVLVGVVFALWSSCAVCQNGITVDPPNNQTVASNSAENVTYNCVVSNGRLAEWVFRGIQLPPGSSAANTLAMNGVFIEAGATNSETNLIITSSARQTVFDDMDLTIRCSALSLTDVNIEIGDVYYVRTFFSPTIPLNVQFNPFPNNLTRLVLTWEQPDNTLIDLGDPVTTTYTVTIAGPTFNRTVNTIDTRYEFTDSLDTPCGTHTFTVNANNDAGFSMPVTINETIPISPDITSLNSSLTVSRIDLSSGVNVEVTFQAATTCSPNFPIISYMVSVVNGPNTTFPVSDPRIMGQDMITLPIMDAGGQLEQDTSYYVIVFACISVTCRDSSPLRFVTTDVQSASITFFENNVLLECTFSEAIAGRGCAFMLTLSTNDTEIITVPVDGPRQCDMTLNMENAYTSIVAVDWDGDMVYGTFPVRVDINPTITDEATFTETTGCVPPVIGQNLSAGAIVGIVIGVIAAILIILAIAIVIAVVCYKQRTKRLPKISRKPNEELAVDFEKHWLMDDSVSLGKKSGSLKKSKVSFRRGASAVDGGDGTEEASIKPVEAAGGPPLPSFSAQEQPASSLTSPPAAFTLYIDKDKKRARLHLNKDLIRRVLKEKRMNTLDRKSRKPRLARQSMRELLLPLPSEIRVTGEDTDDEHADGQLDDIEGEDQNMIAQL